MRQFRFRAPSRLEWLRFLSGCFTSFSLEMVLNSQDHDVGNTTTAAVCHTPILEGLEGRTHSGGFDASCSTVLLGAGFFGHDNLLGSVGIIRVEFGARADSSLHQAFDAGASGFVVE